MVSGAPIGRLVAMLRQEVQGRTLYMDPFHEDAGQCPTSLPDWKTS